MIFVMDVYCSILACPSIIYNSEQQSIGTLPEQQRRLKVLVASDSVALSF